MNEETRERLKNEINKNTDDIAMNEKCPNCGGNLQRKNPQEDDFLDFLDSFYCVNENLYISPMAFMMAQIRNNEVEK